MSAPPTLLFTFTFTYYIIMDFSEGIIKICPYQTVLSGMT